LRKYQRAVVGHQHRGAQRDVNPRAEVGAGSHRFNGKQKLHLAVSKNVFQINSMQQPLEHSNFLISLRLLLNFTALDMHWICNSCAIYGCPKGCILLPTKVGKRQL